MGISVRSKRNDFHEKYLALEESELQAQVQGAAGKKKGRKDVSLPELEEKHRRMLIAPGGADEKEWNAWISL